MKVNSSLVVAFAWGLMAVATTAVAWPQIETLGLYYDEAFLAQQGRDFVDPERAGVHPPSVTTATLAGRPFPIRNAIYLGSLKSQLVIPSFALFGATPSVLRLTTLGVGLLGVLFLMLWTERLWGRDVAVASGLLVVSDPSFHFFAPFEWGPFTSMLLCRGAGLYWLCVGFEAKRSTVRWLAWLAGAASFGLGVYSRVDFAVILGGLLLALLVTRRDVIARALSAHRREVAGAVLVFLLCLSPVIVVVGDVFGAGAGIADRGDLFYRGQVLASVLDGSHYYRLIEVGGLFDQLFDVAAPKTAFIGLAVAASLAALALAFRGKSEEARKIVFLLIAATSILCVMLAIPGAVRAHHMLNVMPFIHVIVAIAGVALWRRRWSSKRRGALARACIGLAAMAGLMTNLDVISQTHALIRETGGTGRFSIALQDFVRDLEANPEAGDTRLVSLDWGFHEPLLFSAQNVALSEPIWAMSESLRRRSRFILNGTQQTVYLYHEAPYDLFGFGAAFAQMLRIHADQVEISEHRDGRGDLVFKSARIAAPHELGFDGTFRLTTKPTALRPPAPAAGQ